MYPTPSFQSGGDGSPASRRKSRFSMAPASFEQLKTHKRQVKGRLSLSRFVLALIGSGRPNFKSRVNADGETRRG